jgi:hypothetical protein
MTNEPLSREGTLQRPLDSLEEHFWLLEKLVPRGHLLAVRLNGSAPEESWRKAFREVQRCHPMLRVSIGKQPGERPYFYEVPDRPIPLTFLEWDDSKSLESFVEGEILKSFLGGREALTRVSVFVGERQSAVVIASHHAVLDGKDHLTVLQDVLDVLDGKPIKAYPNQLSPSTSSLYGRRTVPYLRRSPLNEGDSPPVSGYSIPPIRIIRHTVDKRFLVSALAACRSRQVSFHSALLVALARAGFRLSEEWRRNGIRALTPVDARSNLGLDRRVGMCMVLHRRVFLHGTPFWEEVEGLNRSLKPSEVPQIAATLFGLAEGFVAEEHSSISHLGRIGKTDFVHDLMLTNYGTLDWRGSDRFQIEDMFTAGVAGHYETQKVAAVTRNGNLTLTLVGQALLPRFLETAVEELEGAL